MKLFYFHTKSLGFHQKCIRTMVNMKYIFNSLLSLFMLVQQRCNAVDNFTTKSSRSLANLHIIYILGLSFTVYNKDTNV